MNALIRGLASAWHEYQDRYQTAQSLGCNAPGSEDPEFWAVEMLLTLPGSDPDADLMWECVIEIWRRMDKSDGERIGMFAAGPVEDLIDCHGPRVIDRVEAKAKEDPDFKTMLLGVWPPTDEDRSDWQRLAKLLGDLGPVQSFRNRK